ncbi:A-agglutinin anchorage subunit-like [Stylophora pistillata]|uniref:A-agglutinin anchorage subunit-like n=1 Tax=Stylophora pistillata TaxID=50429 RepID=UPI000C048097|nr:A-agglutinin anchorage subunit-like [Stylophora pistillata]
MTFPHRLKFALSLICCMQHAYGTSVISSNASVKASTTVATSSPTTTNKIASTTHTTTTLTTSNAATSSMVVNTTSRGRTHTAGTPMTTTTTSAAPATVALPSTTHIATKLSSAYAHTTSTSVITSTSMSTMRNASFSIGSGTHYSPLDCKSCSIGGTITVTMSCNIKINGSDEKCDGYKFNKTSCDYVSLGDRGYPCAEVKMNYADYVEKKVTVPRKCGEVCPASGSVLYPHVLFIFASGLVVGMLSQTL